MFKRIIFFIVLPLVFSTMRGANLHHDYSDCDSVRFEDFGKIYDLTGTTGTVIPIDFDYPMNFHLLDDSHLIYSELYQSPTLRILDMDSLDCVGYINLGFEEFDMMGASSIQTQPDSIVTVYDMGTGKLFEFKRVAPMALQFQSARKLRKDNVFKVTKKGNEEYVFTGNMHSDNLYHLLDKKGNVHSYSTIPLIPKEAAIDQVYEYDMQNRLIWNEEKKRLVLAAMGWDIVSIYDGNNNLIKRLRGPLFIDKILRDNQGVVHVPWPYIYGLSGEVQMSDSGFTVAYGGMDEFDGARFNSYLQYIMSYDWDGNPISAIKCPTPAIGYAFDIDSGLLLLVVEEEGKPTMRKYQLK